MKKKRRSPADLRLRAEKRLKRRKAKKPVRRTESDARRLLHELEVHEIELQMQNEELRAARLETEASLERYTALFDFAPIGYATIAIDGTVREINHAGARLLGRERSRLVGQRFASLVAPGDRSAIVALVARALEAERNETCEVEVARSEMPTLQLRLTGTVFPRAKRMILLTMEDITEHKVRETQLLRTEGKLRDADRRKDDFLAVLSHELRNPLAPIRNSLLVLTRAEPGSDSTKTALEIIDRQVTHLTRLVDDLLDITRVTRGKIQLKRDAVDLGDVVRRTMEDQRAIFVSAGVSLDARIGPGPFRVHADSARLVQVVSNLLTNARKFTPRGGNVLVLLEQEGAEASLRIRDTGVGIAPDVIGHLFSPFTQAPQTMDRTRGGLGLGLAMVKGLVELHGGTVEIASDGPGHGAEVRVRLPLQSSPAPSVPREPLRPTSCRRVLVVEDNLDTADSLQDALSLRGHDVQVAYDAPRGLDLARVFRPDVVICDIGLPGMDGYEFARTLRGDEELDRVFLVALSGYAQPEDRRRAADAGFDVHVAKPVTRERLDQILSESSPAGGGNGGRSDAR